MLCLIASHAHAADWQTPQQMAAAQPKQTTEVQAVSLAPTPKFYQVTTEDVAKEVVNQLQLQGVEKKATAKVIATRGTTIHEADHPLQLVIHGLQIDPNSHRWQAQANILSANKTEIVKPVAGFYEPLVTVPTVVHQISRTDVIEKADIVMRDIPARQARKDTITDVEELIGKSPRAQISPERPIRKTEISMPVVIRRGELVEMTYSAPFMRIKTTGVALDDGELGGMLRVKNAKSEKAISTRVTGAGKVEANLSS